MLLSNVIIGSGPGANDGESIYSAFNKVNQNFANVQSNVNALTNSVSSVAGRTGNVTLTINDIVGLSTSYASQANITTANLGMKGYVDSVASQSIYGNSNVASYLLSYSGNLTANYIDANFLTVSNGSTGIDALYVGVPGISPFGNSIASFHGNVNAPTNINVHNKNPGDRNIGGFVATAYSSTFPEAYNATLQVTGEGWNVPEIDVLKPYDALLGAIGGNLNLLAHDKDFSAPSKDIVFSLGYNPTYEKVRISNSSVTISSNLTIASTYVPTANTSVGTRGQIAYDNNYVYVCIATNTWRRANLAAW